MYDVAIVGGGPAGATCAAFCARHGLRTLLLEREKFPREKVCGDCLNPACWPVLQRLDLADRVRTLPHGKLDAVEFIAIGGRTVRLDLPFGENGEIAIKRSSFDELLMIRARELGAEIREQITLTALSDPARPGDWEIEADGKVCRARVLVAADGRNSTVARLCNLLPRVGKERVALQTHLPLPPGFGDRVVLQFLREGYSGQAPVGDGKLNLCLVAKPSGIAGVKRFAEMEFGIATDHPWRTITPLTRKMLPPAQRNLYLVGDAARVVEPFTGEGIYYALRSGELAAQAISSVCNGGDETLAQRRYAKAHEGMYHGRLWVNRLARIAVLNPRITSVVLEVARWQPSVLRFLTEKIVQTM